MRIPDPEKRITHLGGLYDTPYLSPDKLDIEKKLTKYLGKSIIIVYTPRLREVKLHACGVLEHFTVDDFPIYGSNINRKYNVINFRLKDIGTLVLVDGDINDLNFTPTAKGVVNNIIPVSNF